VSRPALEVADIFRDHGPAWRDANRGHISLGQLKVMSAIESCRTAALGGHVMRCQNGACGHTAIAFNSCRDRHCPKCQGAAARAWMQEREAELLPVAIVGDAGPSAGTRRLRPVVAIDRRLPLAELLAGMRTQAPMPFQPIMRQPMALPASGPASPHTSPAAKSP